MSVVKAIIPKRVTNPNQKMFSSSPGRIVSFYKIRLKSVKAFISLIDRENDRQASKQTDR